MSWIVAGHGPAEGFPADRLVPEEIEELHRLLDIRTSMVEQIAVADQRLELLVLSARDRRGLTGRIQVDPETGRIESVPHEDAEPQPRTTTSPKERSDAE